MKKIQRGFVFFSVECHTKQDDVSQLQWNQNYAARIATGNFDYVN